MLYVFIQTLPSLMVIPLAWCFLMLFFLISFLCISIYYYIFFIPLPVLFVHETKNERARLLFSFFFFFLSSPLFFFLFLWVHIVLHGRLIARCRRNHPRLD